MAGQAVQRSYAGAALDYLGARYVCVGSEACSYTIQAVKIPMRDGIELAADFYAPKLPDKQVPAGLIMIQCCYGRGAAVSFINARVYAARGFQALFVSTRGTSGSGGIFDAASNEQSDSQDIVVWMRQQTWYPGFFATVGASYLGYSQWALLRDPPADCVASVILVGPHDYGWHTWGTGSFRMDRVSWSDLMSKIDNKGSLLLSQLSKIPGLGSLWPSGLDEAMAGLPLEASLKKYFGNKAPWLFEYLKHPDVDDVYWTTRRHQTALEQVKTPILLVSGWYDIFTTQTIHQFKCLYNRGVNVRLIVGPWTHSQVSGQHSMPEIMDFLTEHLTKRVELSRSLAHIFITGSQEWRSMPTWPPATRPTILYLQEDRRLGSKQPVQGVNQASFIFDPRNPTPSIGGNQMSSGGRVDDSAYAGRTDVLVFTSEPLSEDLEVLGVPSVHLTHASNPPFADIFVRLSEVDAQGVSYNITEVYQALDPTREMSQLLRLDLQDCAHQFRVGMRMRVIVAGGSFPMHARCLGTAENRVRSDKTAPQEHIVTIAGGVSQLILPVSAAV